VLAINLSSAAPKTSHFNKASASRALRQWAESHRKILRSISHQVSRLRVDNAPLGKWIGFPLSAAPLAGSPHLGSLRLRAVYRGIDPMKRRSRQEHRRDCAAPRVDRGDEGRWIAEAVDRLYPGGDAGAVPRASSHHYEFLPGIGRQSTQGFLASVIENQGNRLAKIRQTFLARLALPIGAGHFGAVSGIPWAVLLDYRREFVAHFSILPPGGWNRIWEMRLF